MDDLPSPSDIERRAQAVGLSITEVCKRAGIAPSTFVRWKAGKTSVSIRNYGKMLAAIDARSAKDAA